MEKILQELDAYKNSLEYLKSIEGCAELSLTSARAMRTKITYLSRTIAAVEHALSFLDETERNIITGLYLKKEQSFDDVCEFCALERSSVYRYRARALAKLATAMFGGVGSL